MGESKTKSEQQRQADRQAYLLRKTNGTRERGRKRGIGPLLKGPTERDARTQAKCTARRARGCSAIWAVVRTLMPAPRSLDGVKDAKAIRVANKRRRARKAVQS